jgi:phosphoglycolate phosphatase
MKKNSFKAILFDLDGTLLDTLNDLANSMNAVLSAQGLKIYPVDDYRYLVGKGLRELIKSVLPEHKADDKTIDELLAAMKIEYGKRWAENTKPYPGIPDLLDVLQKHKFPMVVLSNKADEFTRIMVEKLLPDWKFQIVRGLRNNIPAKPDPASSLEIAGELKIKPHEFVYLGDTDIDMQTANAAGMYAVGALWGFRDAAELKANGAKTLVESPLQVLDLLNFQA